ncbi:MAG: DUF4386 domain-containing protein [Pseudonocardiaceae bacterium]
MTTTLGTSPTTTTRDGGPPLLVPGLAFAALTLGGAILGSGTPRPADAAAQVLSYDQNHGTVLAVSATLLFASAIPLVIWAVTAYRRLGVRVPGPLMGVAGGVLAAASIALSGLFAWTAGQTAQLADPALARTLTSLSFSTGAAGFVVPFGLLITGIAVPSLILKRLPRALAWAGVVMGALGMLATLTLLIPALDPLLPIGRFGGVIWLVVASVLLPAGRRPRPAATSTGPS